MHNKRKRNVSHNEQRAFRIIANCDDRNAFGTWYTALASRVQSKRGAPQRKKGIDTARSRARYVLVLVNWTLGGWVAR